MKNYVIGILGLASYATIDLQKKIVDAFPAEKEWDRPHIIVDNNCVIPSRVRAILYNENVELVINQMTKSVEYLLKGGCDRIIVDCNTAHYFLPNIIENIPEAKGKIINLIDDCAKYIYNKYGSVEVGLIASEGVIDTKIYHNIFSENKINVFSPNKEKYGDIRQLIESVKQNKIDKDSIKLFECFIESFHQKYVILGCTEIPILYDEAVKLGYSTEKLIIDPIKVSIDLLIREYNDLPLCTF